MRAGSPVISRLSGTWVRQVVVGARMRVGVWMLAGKRKALDSRSAICYTGCWVVGV